MGCPWVVHRLYPPLADELTPIFTLFFQASLKQGTIPIDWTTANVVPIFKKGDRLQPINYRPISLTSITCKMFEHIITSNIMQHLDSHNILHDAQHGFRKHRSTETQLIQLIDNLAHNIDTRIQTDAILLDFQKAFGRMAECLIASVAEWLRAWDTLTMFEATVCGRSWVRSPTGAI